MTLLNESLHIYLLDATDDVPVVKASTAVKKDHTLMPSVDGKKIPASKFKDIVKGPLKHMSQLINLMARIKNWSEDTHFLCQWLHCKIYYKDNKMRSLQGIPCDEGPTGTH